MQKFEAIRRMKWAMEEAFLRGVGVKNGSTAMRSWYEPWEINTANRDRPGGHMPARYYNPWKKADKKKFRREQKKIVTEALRDYEYEQDRYIEYGYDDFVDEMNDYVSDHPHYFEDEYDPLLDDLSDRDHFHIMLGSMDMDDYYFESILVLVNLEATMTDRHLSNRFERGTREQKLVRQYEIYMSGLDTSRIALLDIDTRHDMLLLCDREDGYYIWILQTDPDSYEDDFYEYSTYEAARKAFDGWEAEPLQPNWEAQAEYDEMHGTINGEDAGIVMMRELWGE